MATRKLRPQQYRIEGSRPWADSAEDIDTMFETLFKQIKQLQNAVAPTPVVSGAVDVSHIVGSIPRSPIVEPEQGRIGPPGVPGATGPQGPVGSGAAAIGPPGRPGQDAEAPFNPMGALNTPSVTGTGVLVRANSPALTGSPTAPTQSTSDNSTDIATTAFVTTAIANAIAGVNPAVAVQAASAAILPNSPTYNNGASGIGAFITTLTLNTALVVDGYTPSLNDRILVKNEGDASGLGAAKNGVYTVTQIAAVGVAWILTRALDYDMPSNINNTGAIPVVNGTVNTLTSWLLTSLVTIIGTDALTYTLFSFKNTGFANPTASVGLTAINGTATTTMRSDAAPALNVSIAPTWTGIHTWTVSAAIPMVLNSTAANGGYFKVATSGTEIIDFGSAKAIGFGGASTSTDGGFFAAVNDLYVGAANNINFTHNNVIHAVLSSAGAWQWQAYGAGTLTTDASGNVTAVSDARFKDRVAPLPYGLEEVLALKPVQYGYNERSGLEREHLYGGFLAQEVQDVMPLAVNTNVEGFLTLADRPIIGALVHAVQVLTKRLQELEVKQ